MAKHTTEAELKALIGQGLSVLQIAAKLGINEQAVRAACRVLGLITDGRRRKGASAEDYIEDMRSGLSMAEIAMKHGKNTETAVYQALRRAGLPTTLRELVRREQKAA